MTVLPIVTGEDSLVLRAKTELVPKVSKEILKLINNMQETVKKAEGLGIAAPQIGKSLRICLAQFNGKMNPLINPTIMWFSEEKATIEEGCLSLPGVDIKVERAVEIIVSYTDEKGDATERRLHDLDARVVLHEVDHLDGVLIVDYQQ